MGRRKGIRGTAAGAAAILARLRHEGSIPSFSTNSRPRLGGRASRCQREGWDSISHGRSRGSGDAQDRRGGAFEVCAGEPRRSPGHKVSRAYSSTVERAVYNCVIVGSTPRAPTSFHAVRPGVRLGSYPDLGAFDSRRRNQIRRRPTAQWPAPLIVPDDGV